MTKGSPDVLEEQALAVGDQVRHAKHGLGLVVAALGTTTVARFDDGIHECETTSLQRLLNALQSIERSSWDAPQAVISYAQAAAIRSVSNAWGVFSRSRIALLPHQLWVCRRVNEAWPARWLVADDVGLGKTIEAGLILTPLVSQGVVRRFLVICPAALVDQWQERLRTMFDIRVAQYVADADTARSDFWATHNQVVVSLQTIRADHRGRHQRLLESPPWDLVIVDEAHHLNADEESGPTLGYRLLEWMLAERRVVSLLFFTGTPHRGKTFGFLALLHLLRPDWFDPRKPLAPQLPRLRDVMIRNNKRNATDLRGQRLFQPTCVAQETYEYSDEERAFYDMLTSFIVSGKAYASGLSAGDARMATLVLIAMQKLASSSVAAIRRAIKRRLARIQEERARLQKLEKDHAAVAAAYGDLESSGLAEELAKLEEELAETAYGLRLMEDEEPRLVELVAAAERVTTETKISRILDLVASRFADRSVLFFTEYKATQSLLMSALIRRHGADAVTFINGDDRADDLVDGQGIPVSLHQPRAVAEEAFRTGRARFLVSTEAAGEGVDLQENCHTLVHVDLPWNPMRLHQRVGRLDRYGQDRPVDVVSLRNPETVEARIWDKLNGKIASINEALAHAMDEPEDLFQLVLGMTPPALFREVFSEASQVPASALNDWFDRKTAHFGGQDVIRVVRDLVGSCSRFDFQDVSPLLPKLDLPDLQPFFEAMLRHNRRRIRRTDRGISFLTPETWLDEPGVRSEYEDMTFDRGGGREPLARVLGVGHKLVDRALRDALELEGRVATVPRSVLPRALALYQLRDRITGEDKPSRPIVVAVAFEPHQGADQELLRDWEVFQHLNEIVTKAGTAASTSPAPDLALVRASLVEAERMIGSRLSELVEGMRVPEKELLAVLWPIERAGSDTLMDGGITTAPWEDDAAE